MSEKPPCECIQKIDGRWTYRCECSNGGSAEYAASWVADENAQDEIARLTAENEKLDEAMEMLLTDVRRTDLDMRGLKAENERLSAYAKRAAMDVLLCKDGNILLHEKNEKLRAALLPLACTCDRPNGAACSRSEVDCPFWNARAALEKKR